MAGQVLEAREGAVGWITFSNPAKRNAMSMEMWGQLARILDAWREDASIRVAVMRGDGDRAFVSGADISQFEDNRADAAAAAKYDAVSEGARAALAGFPKPLIAMIRGYCLGGGLGIALTADLRFAAEDARFGIPAANLGVAYSGDSLRRLVSLVGPAMAKDILFSARQLDAAEAHRVGLAQRLLPAETLEAAVRDYAAALAGKAPLTQRASKTVINELMKPESAQDAALMRRVVAECFDSQDYAEGRRAFMEKRKPVFRGV